LGEQKREKARLLTIWTAIFLKCELSGSEKKIGRMEGGRAIFSSLQSQKFRQLEKELKPRMAKPPCVINKRVGNFLAE